jgi:hypothetical protein
LRGGCEPASADRLGIRRRLEVKALLALLLAAFALRFIYRIDYDEDIDSLRFALAVEHFDVASLRPHAPFYPVYIALAKVLALFVGSPHEALGLLGALSGALTVVFCALLGREVVGARAGWVAGLLALASPFLWLSSEKCSSDITGTAFVTAGLFCAAKARRAASRELAHALRTTALIVLGLGLGARLSYFPFAIGCLVAIAAEEGRLRAFAARLRDLLVGIVVWLVPLIVVAGAGPLVVQTRIQALGHFTRWGGSVLTVSSPTERLYGLVWGAWANVLGGAWPDAPRLRWLGAPILVALLVFALRSAFPLRAVARRHPEIVISSLLYLGWAALGQNIAFKPRHLLPLTPVLVVALARGFEALAEATRASRASLLLVAALALQWLVDGAGLARAHAAPSPAASVVRFLRDSRDPRPVLSRDLERMIAAAAPGRRVIPARDEEALLLAVDAEKATGVYITSETLSEALQGTLQRHGHHATIVFSQPRSRYVDSLWNELSLYAVEASGGGR